MFLHHVRIECRVVLHLDGIGRGAFQGDRESVVAHHANTGELSSGCHGAVTGGGQQHVCIGLVITLERARLTGTGQCPHFPAAFQNTCGFQFKTGYFCQVPVELQDLFRLDHFEAITDYRQRCSCIRAIKHFGIRVRQDLAQGSTGIGDVANWAVLDLPVQTSLLCPDFQRLICGEFIPQAMPRGSANVGHLLDEMSHGCSPMEFARGISGYRRGTQDRH